MAMVTIYQVSFDYGKTKHKMDKRRGAISAR